MSRFISAILIFFSLASPLCSLNVAAQELQQSQSSDTGASVAAKPISLKIPDGTPIEVEAPYTYRSIDFKPKDKISFRVVNPITIEGVAVIEAGATATGRIEKAKRGGHWGKAGLFLWTMESVTAKDGSQIPVRPTSIRLRGDSKGAKVATQMIITGALMPFIAPVALLHGFKRGKDAFIPAGKRYSIFVDGDSSVSAEAPVTDKANTAP